ncbi:hypothetical protein LTR38_017695 [Friedmanniomyces endolithicus]|nr:hypothetical protein LTR38_017695 [Friedmanniomyces endolithicus]
MKEHVSQYASALYLDHLSDHSQPQPVLEGEESPELPSEPIHLVDLLQPPQLQFMAVQPYRMPQISLVSMETGATELFAKLPLQLLTTLRCVPNYIGGHHIYGSLDEVSDKYKYSHRDFNFYRRLLDLFAKGQDLSLLADTKQATGNDWDLDKWKFVPIAHRVYVEQPDIK